ncbi:MAG: Asp23/Gls24 family envelope stress response protein [Chlamydiia bacterium]|nr:Asp23/Gls24 family envelope stress response protein [Chlamydiia bacterium]
MFDQLKNMDAREVELPDTVFVRDIETRVFQGIVLQTLAKISGVGLLEGNLFDSLLGREIESVKGIYVEQDQKKHSVEIRVEVNIVYGVSIPEKAEEIQTRLVEEVSRWTGLHVASVHVIFKDLITSGESVLQPDGTASPIGEFEGAF